MTNVQVSYAEHQENARHNVATEQEANRHNVVTETETHRSNRANEKETKRSHKAQEKHNRNVLAEQQRHSMVTESQTDRQLSEQERHQRASEDVQKYSAEMSAYGRITAAQIAAASAQFVAQLQANVNLQIASMKDYQAKLDREAANARNSQNAATSRYINKAQNLTKKAIAAADRYQRAIQHQDEVDIQKAQQDIDKLRIQVDKAYKDDKIKLDTYQFIMDVLEKIAPAVKKAAEGEGFN